MLTLKCRKNFRMAFAILIVALILLAEPVLAGKGPKKAGKSGGGSTKSQQRSQQAQKAPAAPKARSSSPARRTAARAPAPSRPTVRRAQPSTSRPSIRQSSQRTTSKSNAPQVRRQEPSSTRPSYQPNKVVSSRSTTTQPARVNSRGPKPSSNFSSGKKSIQVSSRAGKQPTISSSNRISPSKTARIGKAVGRNKPSVAATRKATPAGKPKTTISSGKTSRIGKAIGGNKPSIKATRKTTPADKPKTGISSRIGKSIGNKKAIGSTLRKPEKKTGTIRERLKNRLFSSSKANNRTSSQNPSLFTRPAGEKSQHVRPANEKSQHIRVEGKRTQPRSKPVLSRTRDTIARLRKPHREGMPIRTKYRERRDIIKHPRRHEHVYYDHRNRIHRRIVLPRYRYIVRYNWGPYWAFRYVYPYYHRKYIFVSLGGYWPIEYTYVRYYWYGYHPYYWCGYYPIAREVVGDTYNYYTYNYYYDGTTECQSSQATGDIGIVDHTTFADVREKLAQQALEEPAEETLADKYFEDAVEAFAAEDYDTTIEMFAAAMELAPDDMVLPFAYCQALFAAGKYTEAAEVLRGALANVSPEQEGVFYPRGLYTEDDILLEQVDMLAEQAELYSFDADLQLLLGYQLLGIGETDAAIEPLQLANQDMENASSAAVLLNLSEKIRTESTEENIVGNIN